MKKKRIILTISILIHIPISAHTPATNKSIKICFIFIILIALTIVSYLIINKNGGKDFNFNKLVNENKITYPIVNKISLVATGDALLHNPVYISAYDNSTESFNFAPQLELVKEEIKNYDIKYYNEEIIEL